MSPKPSPAGAHSASPTVFESEYQKTFVDKLNYGHNAEPSFRAYPDLASSSSGASGSKATIPQDDRSPDIWYCLILHCGKHFSGSWDLAAHVAEVHQGSYEFDVTHPACARQCEALVFWTKDAVSHTDYTASQTPLRLSMEKNSSINLSHYVDLQPAIEHLAIQPAFGCSVASEDDSDTSTQDSDTNTLTEYLVDDSEVDGTLGTAPSIMSSEPDTKGSLSQRGEASKRPRSVSPQQREFLQSKKLAVTSYHASHSNVRSSDSVSEDTASGTDLVCIEEDFDHEGLQDSQEGLKCSCEFSNRKHVLREHCQRLKDDPGSIQTLLPEEWKWDLKFQSGLVGSGATGVWTCTPFEPEDLVSYPLTIAEAPVVIPVEHRWPPMGGVNPPPDPRPLSLVDRRTTLSIEIVRDIFMTFEGCIGFYFLINGTLQLIVSEQFDTTLAASHLPHKYGGLRICYIKHDMQPTMLPTNQTTLDARSNSNMQRSAFSKLFRSSRPASIATTTATTLQLNDFIEARGSSGQKQKYAGRIGLRVAKEGSQFLLMSSHVITEAILSRSFLGAGRVHIERLKEDWNRYAEIWAANERIGVIEKSFDTEVGLYPEGFKYDCALVRAPNPSLVQDIKSPIADMGWLSRDAWSSLRQQTSLVKILGRTESHRNVKSLKCHLCSDVLVVGEGIFLNQTMAAGKQLRDHSPSTWESLVSRALLYRVSPDFDPPTGYSGIALYAEGTREDGSQGPGIVGLQSFVQTSDSVQSFDMEGPALEQRLRKGRVAFYGAFQIPDELRQNYQVV